MFQAIQNRLLSCEYILLFSSEYNNGLMSSTIALYKTTDETIAELGY